MGLAGPVIRLVISRKADPFRTLAMVVANGEGIDNKESVKDVY